MPNTDVVAKLAQMISQDVDDRVEDNSSVEDLAHEETNSSLPETVPYRVIKLIKQELRKMECRVDKLRFNFYGHASGYDILFKGAKPMRKKAQRKIRERLKEAMPEAGYKMDKYPSRYCYAAVHSTVAQKLEEEFGLDVIAYFREKSDIITLSISHKRKQKEDPEDLDLEMDDESEALDFSDDLLGGDSGLPEEEGMEEAGLLPDQGGEEDVDLLGGPGGEEEEDEEFLRPR